MKFSAFYFLAGAMVGVAAIRTTIEAPGFGFLFVGAIALTALGAVFEACNPKP